MRRTSLQLALVVSCLLGLVACGMSTLTVVPEIFCTEQQTVQVEWSTAGASAGTLTAYRGTDKKGQSVKTTPWSSNVHQVPVDSEARTVKVTADRNCCDYQKVIRKIIEPLDRQLDVSVGGGASCVNDEYTQVTHIDPRKYADHLTVFAVTNRSPRDVTVEQFAVDPRPHPEAKPTFTAEVAQGDSINVEDKKLRAFGYWRVKMARGDMERCLSRPAMNGMMPGHMPTQMRYESDPQVVPLPVLANLQIGCAKAAAAQAVESPSRIAPKAKPPTRSRPIKK